MMKNKKNIPRNPCRFRGIFLPLPSVKQQW
nr:MAG TPA: hypothetical protein [Caudoviricetes sp.]